MKQKYAQVGTISNSSQPSSKRQVSPPVLTPWLSSVFQFQMSWARASVPKSRKLPGIIAQHLPAPFPRWSLPPLKFFWKPSPFLKYWTASFKKIVALQFFLVQQKPLFFDMPVKWGWHVGVKQWSRNVLYCTVSYSLLLTLWLLHDWLHIAM